MSRAAATDPHPRAERHIDLEPPLIAVREVVALALREDLLPLGDLTAQLVPEQSSVRAGLVSRRQGVVAGVACLLEVCRVIDPDLAVEVRIADGGAVAPGGVIAQLSGSLRSLVTAERTALNLVSHLSGVATLTRAYVEAAGLVNPAVRIADTRKTTPGLRALEKAAVRAGGGVNHRGSLSEGVLIKDNHLGGISIPDAVALARRRWPGRMIEVECDHLDQVSVAIAAGATMVLLDNMTPAEVAQAVSAVEQLRRRRALSVLVEVSGGIDLTTVAAYAQAAPDLISVGALTHSAPSLDIGLDLTV
jgi:nicotinate-nucleotide pyrophosphorylase (carboxylating)